MDNPWSNLPVARPYVLQMDADWMFRQNERAFFNIASIPEPFIGNPRTATVVLLNLNPSDDSSDLIAHAEPQFRQALFRNLRHEAMDFPFHAIDPNLAWTGCGKWWSRVLREVFDVARLNREVVAQRLAVIEWFPYHAEKSRGVPKYPACPSQQYSFELARQALHDRLVVGMRAKPRWSGVDPRFAGIPYLKNWRNPTLSRGNMTPSLWEMLVNALR